MVASLKDDAFNVLRLNATEVEALRVPPGSTSHQAAKDPAYEIGTAAHPRPSRRIYRELACLRHLQPQQHFNNNSSLHCLIPIHANSFVFAVQSSPPTVIYTKAINPRLSLTTNSSESNHPILQTYFHTRYQATAVKSLYAYTVSITDFSRYHQEDTASLRSYILP